MKSYWSRGSGLAYFPPFRTHSSQSVLRLLQQIHRERTINLSNLAAMPIIQLIKTSPYENSTRNSPVRRVSHPLYLSEEPCLQSLAWFQSGLHRLCSHSNVKHSIKAKWKPKPFYRASAGPRACSRVGSTTPQCVVNWTHSDADVQSVYIHAAGSPAVES